MAFKRGKTKELKKMEESKKRIDKLENRMTKQKVEHLLSVSYQDYEKYKKERDLDYLRDVAEKVFTTAENYVEYKTKSRTSNYKDFKRLLKEINISEEEKSDLKRDMSLLHKFAKHSLEEPDEISDIEELYESTHEKLLCLTTKAEI